MKFTQLACPRILRFSDPNRSPAKLSPPHWRTIAPGLYLSITCVITGSNILKRVSIIAQYISRRGHTLCTRHHQSRVEAGSSLSSSCLCYIPELASLPSIISGTMQVGIDATYSAPISRNSPVPGKNSPYWWKDTVITLSVVKNASSTPSPWCTSISI